MENIKRIVTVFTLVMFLVSSGCSAGEGAKKISLVTYLENTAYCNLVFYGGKLYIRNPAQSSLAGDDPGNRVFKGYYGEFLVNAQKEGLLTFQAITGGGWDQFLAMNLTGTPYTVNLSQKLLDVCHTQQNGGHVFKFGRIEIKKIVKDEKYTGPLVTSGENARLVLGVYRNTPTEHSSVFGSLVPQQANEYRFRSIMKYDDFAKKWNVVAFDYGLMNSDAWQSNTVQ